jgi:hypothetical protein
MDEEDHYSEESPDPTPLIESVLSDYADQVTKALREGRLTDAMTIYQGVYEGTLSVTEPQDDEFGVIGDYPTEAWEVWHGLLADAYTQLAQQVLRPDQIIRSLGQLAERATFFDNKNDTDDETEDEDDFYDEQAPGQIWYNLKSFEPLLLALVTDRPSAQVVQQAIAQHNWQLRGTEYVQLRIADVLSDSDLWLQTADRFTDHDPEIGLQLLQHRRQMGDRPILIQTLHRLNKLFPKTFDDFILNTLDNTLLTPGPDLTLYLTSLENRCRSAGQLPDYLKLRDYLTENQRHAFTDSLRPATDYYYLAHPLFYAQVLHTEGRNEDLLTWLDTINWKHTYELSDILPIAAQTHPNECMSMLMERVSTLLQGGKRDRRLYETIAGWLASLSTVPSLKPQVALFVGQLLANYNRLSAMRDEFRQKGLVRQ